MKIPKGRSIKKLVPYAATALTLSLAANLKIEHSCSQEPPVHQYPAVLYTYLDLLVGIP